MSSLKTKILVVVSGEGGSGGALAIGVADKVLMLQFSTYAVISPEGCASILWKSAEKAPEAAEAMGITAPTLLSLGLIDRIVDEPIGGAHRDTTAAIDNVRRAIIEELPPLLDMDAEQLVRERRAKLASYGNYKEK